jgi:20S proteasome alpha/beta subunit
MNNLIVKELNKILNSLDNQNMTKEEAIETILNLFEKAFKEITNKKGP